MRKRKDGSRAMDYLNAIKAGYEVVVIAANKSYNSAVFYGDEEGNVYAWTRELGEIKHKNTDKLIAHFEQLVADGDMLVIRGVAYGER